MLISNMTPVTEAYFGKTKNLKEAEKILSKIVAKYKVPIEKVGKRMIDATELNKSKLNEDLQNVIKKQFGFAKVKIHWDGSEKVNAYTCGTNSLIRCINGDIPPKPLKQNDGTYFDKSHDYLCFINVYMGLIDLDCNGEELLAVILHEIGHNFQCTLVCNFGFIFDVFSVPYNLIKAYENFRFAVAAGITAAIDLTAFKFLQAINKFIIAYFIGDIAIDQFNLSIAKALGVLVPEKLKDIHIKGLEECDRWLVKNKNKVMVNWKNFVNDIKDLEKSNKNSNKADINTIFSCICLGYITMLAPLEMGYEFAAAQIGYSGEVFADSFATSYGYGHALSSFLNKIEKYKFDRGSKMAGYLNKTNRNVLLNQYLMVIREYMTGLFDPHPLHQTRIKNQVNKLKRELESEEVDPELKKSIEYDLAKAKKVYDDFLAMPKEYRYLTVIMNFRHINELYFNGKLEFKAFLDSLLNLGNSEA